MAEIHFKNISKIYPNKHKAVDNFNLHIKDKEFIVLVGPSGCGKSTTLRMIAGLEDISKGELSIDQKVVNNLPPKDRDIAIVFQNYALYPHMTAYNNLAFGLKIKGFSKKEIRERVMEAAKILEIEDLLDRKPSTMSGGQRQRVAIGRAIVRKPKVFLFDEPLSNLDAKLRVQMRFEIAGLHQRLQTTVVYVTHDQVEAMTLGSRIVVMDKGEIKQVDTPTNLYYKPDNLFVAGFIGTPPMNLIEGTIEKCNNNICFIDKGNLLKIEFPLDHVLFQYINKKVVLGIRPENVLLDTSNNNGQFTKLSTEVLFIERLGHEMYTFVKLGDKQIVSRLKSTESLKKADSINLYFDHSKMFFFDYESENAIN